LENVDIFYDHSEYFTDICNILRPFGTFCDNLVHFSHFGIMYQEKSGNPELECFSRQEKRFALKTDSVIPGPIVQLLTLQLQCQRCCRLRHF
jgi:hypothetical protein